jgi:hypothetical protein
MGKTKFAKKSDKPQLFGVFRRKDFKQRMKDIICDPVSEQGSMN